MEVTTVFNSLSVPVSVGQADGALLVGTEDGGIYVGNRLITNLNVSRLLDVVHSGGDSYIVSYLVPDNDAWLMRVSEISPPSTSESVLLEVPKSSQTNNGGRLLLEDGFLHVLVGDDGMGQQEIQNPNTLVGKAVRLSMGSPGTPPTGNMYATFKPGRDDNPFIYAVGFRDPTSICADSATGEIATTDDFYYTQKIDTLMPGRNYGWNIKQGRVSCAPVGNICVPNLFPVPHHSFRDGNAVGGVLVNGYYYYGDGSDRVFVLERKGRTWKAHSAFQVPGVTVRGISLVDGSLYVFGFDRGGVVCRVTGK